MFLGLHPCDLSDTVVLIVLQMWFYGYSPEELQKSKSVLSGLGATLADRDAGDYKRMKGNNLIIKSPAPIF